MKNICPICLKHLNESRRDNKDYVDYKCHGDSDDDHFYVHRILNGDIIKIKFRIDDMYLKINFDEGFSQAWPIDSLIQDRVTVNHALELDFSDLEKIKSKIKTILTFS